MLVAPLPFDRRRPTRNLGSILQEIAGLSPETLEQFRILAEFKLQELKSTKKAS